MSNLAILTDEDGNFIGQKDRYQLVSGDMIAIACLWVENARGQVLIAQRSPKKKNDPGLWGPAAAGTLEPDETFLENVIKETKEEIGLEIEPEEVRRIAYWRHDGTGRYAVWFRAKVDMPTSAFILQEEEVAAVRWIDRTELLQDTKAHPERYVGTPERWEVMATLGTES